MTAPDTDPDHDAVRAAYMAQAVKQQDWVPLRTLRPALPGDRDHQDRVLYAMLLTGEVHLAPDSNRKTLTDEDHEAAIVIGGEPKHLLAVALDAPHNPYGYEW